MATMAQKAALSASQNHYSSAKQNTASSKKKYDTAYNNYSSAVKKGYTESSQVKSYRNQSDKALAAAKAMGDFSYQNKYTNKITGMLDKAENMQFDMNYSLTDDPAYQSYRDQYVHNGQLAAMDAAGNAVAQTGGYGSTAATAASQQAYNESLTQLNNIVPELYSQAYNREWNKFTNERDTLQQLAAAYQSLDQQGYEQALSTWTNNFNQYITIAQEYEQKYEYLDSAQRAQYESQLDGLYNMLTSAQSQYNTNQNIEQAALSTYNNMSNDIANYEETVRSNKASEAAAAAQLAEQRRQYNISASQSKTYNNSSGSYKYTASQLQSSYSRATSRNYITVNGKKVNSSYKDAKGLESDIYNKFKNGELSESDTAYLLNYYGLA